jgi:hypothetical protein
MNFKINNTDLLTEPSDHNWQKQVSLGYDGNAHPIYPAPRSYLMKWDWCDAASFSQLENFYNSCSGTIPITLPTFGSPTGGYSVYSCTLEEPSYTSSFDGFFGSVSFLILNIK